MARKKSAIVLSDLSRESVDELESMVGDLISDAKADSSEAAKPAPWSRRFAASGKFQPPP